MCEDIITNQLKGKSSGSGTGTGDGEEYFQ